METQCEEPRSDPFPDSVRGFQTTVASELRFDAILEAMVQFSEAIQDAARCILDALVPAFQAFRDELIRVRRLQLLHSLKRAGVPPRPARWLANSWPVRFLPALNPFAFIFFEQSDHEEVDDDPD